MYHCTASNKYGSDSMVVYLAVQEAPSAPSGLEVLEAGSRWLSLGWAVDGSGATHHVIQFRREPSSASDASAADNSVVSATPPQPQPWYNVTVPGGGQRSAKVTGLDPATTYAIRVLAANEVGVGPPGSPVTAQTLQEAPTLPPADVTADPFAPESLTVRWKVRGLCVNHRQV
ncbi:Down syndrome cell adhesion molecule-like protein Dscam2 [Thrips palmi]|uniref:Down syndrome cell adhesion molecule-like protein Dscam2 n=1 Tax=Thrips palmi TaxID=161013 RepID=A0A6P8Y9F0_THRPL|nr:Down syndrome cell adhesion molecule-like protein Dscam2 [Thrips palmi]